MGNCVLRADGPESAWPLKSPDAFFYDSVHTSRAYALRFEHNINYHRLVEVNVVKKKGGESSLE